MTRQCVSSDETRRATTSLDSQVFAIMIFAFSIRLGELTAMFFSRMKPGERRAWSEGRGVSSLSTREEGRRRELELNVPSSRYESVSLPPTFLIIWMCSRSVDP